MSSKLGWQVPTTAENNSLTELEGAGQTPKGAQTVVLGLREVRPHLLGKGGLVQSNAGSSRAGTGEGWRRCPDPTAAVG